MKTVFIGLLLTPVCIDSFSFTSILPRKKILAPSSLSQSTGTTSPTNENDNSTNDTFLINNNPSNDAWSSSSSSNLRASYSSSSSSAASTLENLQTKLITQTLLRISIPSIVAAFLCFLTFAPATHAIFNYVQTSYNGIETGAGYEALNLILTDNSNQFIQNAHNFLALNFCFLTTYTFSFLYNNQVKLYNALYDEVGTIISLLEQVALSTEGRVDLYKLILLCIRKYINDDLKVVTNLSSCDSNVSTTTTAALSNVDSQDLPVYLVSQRPQQDPLETILYLTSVGQPSHVYSTIKSLRQARANRLASLQRKMPEVNMYLLYILGFTAWVTFPIVTAGSSTVGGEELINVYRNELSLGIFAMGFVLGIINELKQPEVGSAYNVDYNLLGKLMDGLEEELNFRLSKCGLYDDRRSIGTGTKMLDKKELDELSSKLVANTFELSKEIDQGNDYDWAQDVRVDDFGVVERDEISTIAPLLVENVVNEKNNQESQTIEKKSWFRRRILGRLIRNR